MKEEGRSGLSVTGEEENGRTGSTVSLKTYGHPHIHHRGIFPLTHTDFKILLLLCWPAKSLVVAVTDGGGLTICAKASGPEKRALRRYFGIGAFSAVSTWVSCGKYDVAALRRCGLGRRQLPFQQQQGSRSFRIPAALTISTARSLGSILLCSNCRSPVAMPLPYGSN